MAIKLIKDDTEFEGMGSDGKRTATRHMVFSYDQGDTQMDLADSDLLPRVRDMHPEYNYWYVDSIGKPQYFDNPKQYIIDVTYLQGGATASGLGDYVSKNENAPWRRNDYSAQISTYEKEVPLNYWYDKDGNPVLICNTAGDRIPFVTTVSIIRISFSQNYKSSEKRIKFDIPDTYILNSNSEEVFGITIPPYCGKMLPFTIEKHIIINKKGKKVCYDTVNYTIEIAPNREGVMSGWKKELLNVGTRAVFKKSDGSKYVSQIYTYRDIEKYDKKTYFDDLAKSKIKYGSLVDLIAARKKFLDSSTEATSSMFPYEEITTPMPLNDEGEIDLEALKSKKYKKIGGYETIGQSWSRYDLPAASLGAINLKQQWVFEQEELWRS